MKILQKHIYIWWKLTLNASQIAFASRFGAVIFLFGKLLRFAFFLMFLLLIGERTQDIAGYTLWQIIFIFATFNVVDTVPQFFFREVYRFRYYIIRGDFDFILIKPLNPLFRTLLGGSDVLDLGILVISLGFIWYSGGKIGAITVEGVFLYVLLLVNAFIISLSFHIFVLCLGLFSTVVDNTLWMYRDLTQMGRLPITIYQQPLQAIITFVIPIGIMMTFPPQALFGTLSKVLFVSSFVVSTVLLSASLLLWKYALKNYTSASS